MEETKQHGVKGAYVGGDWVNIEECADKFNIKNGSCKNKCPDCPRSRTKNCAAKPDGTYDVIIIGSGCIGSAVARELSKTTNHVLVLESADDVTQGATKGNSGIVHAGFDDVPGSMRAKFCWPGNQMFPQLDNELHFGYQRNGSLVLARNEEDMEHLKILKARGETNGVQRLCILNKEEVFAVEPHVHPDTVGALLAPDAGNLIPYEYAIALAENAVDNGVEMRIRRQVSQIAIEKGTGVNNTDMFAVTAKHWEPASYLRAQEAKRAGASPASEPVQDATPPAKVNENSMSNKIVFASFVVVMIGTLITRADFLAEHFKQPIETVYGAGAAAVGVMVIILAKVFLGDCCASSSSCGSAKASSSSSSSSSTSAKAELSEQFVSKMAGSVGTGGHKVTVGEMTVGGSGSCTVNDGELVEMETYRARYVVNCAGSGSDKIANMIHDHSFKIKPRIGDYLLLNRNQGHLAKHTLFPCPGKLGKGVLVQTTLWGNLILGPTARDMHIPEIAAESDQDIQTFILSKCKALVPTFDPKEVIHAFCGARAKSDRGDWIIEPSQQHASFIHAAGIDSPGLAGSPAIAVEVTRLLAQAGLALEPNPTFNPNRAPIIVPKSGWKGIKAGPVGKFTDPKENVVCKCEKVTEAEVVTALQRSLPIDSTQAIRKRTRAGMGHCQADGENYNCECRVAAIIARETEQGLEEVGRRPWPATSTLPQRWPSEQEKDQLVQFMKVDPVN